MWRTKNSSPSTEPRGTPHSVIWGADVTSLTVNAMNFLVKEERKHWKKRRRKIRDPKVALMRVNGKTRYIVSKAADTKEIQAE